MSHLGQAASPHDRIVSATNDLEARTLGRIESVLARLVYLASTRDYNSGEYHHEGLAFRYGQDAAAKALESCHRKVFEGVVTLPLRSLCEELTEYIESSGEPEKTLEAWRRLKAYQLLVPAACDAISAGLFNSNVQLALGVFLLRQRRRENDR